MADANQQRLMKIALVGVRPADQVTLKGYLRVLLRLDVELQWVAATDPDIDLFMINHEFRTAASVTKLLNANIGTPVLYVQRSTNDEGGLTQNLLTLPLKHINILNDWLLRQVPLLRGSGLQMSSTAENATPTETTTGNLESLIDLIKRLQQRKAGLFELSQAGQTVAIIEGERQRLWVRSNINKISTDLQLKPYNGETPDPKDAKDASNYLWLLACHNPEALLPLIDNGRAYRLRFWAKPASSHRRDFLQVMTALEKETLTPTQLANQVGVSILTAKKVLAALLFSGNLTTDTYHALKSPSNQTQTPETGQPATQTPPSAPPKAASENQEKMGFLSRLRRKLGL